MTPTLADLQQARQQVALEQLRRRYVVDAWAWVAECVWTVDELDPQSPVKPFPVAVCVGCSRYLGHADRAICPGCGQPPAPLTYLETLARQWQRADPPLLLVPKARRMKLTWLFCALHTWLACVRPYVNAFLVSSKEQKSIELLDRVEGILMRCPRDRYRPPTWTRQQDLLMLENGSRVWAVAEGASARAAPVEEVPGAGRRQRGSGGANRRSGFIVCSGSQNGTNCHQPASTGTGTYSVVQPHQAGMWSVRPGSHPCGRRYSARMRMTATSRPHVQQARVGRRRPAASSQVGGVISRDNAAEL